MNLNEGKPKNEPKTYSLIDCPWIFKKGIFGGLFQYA
jgi:hypothetical protein